MVKNNEGRIQCYPIISDIISVASTVVLYMNMYTEFAQCHAATETDTQCTMYAG